MDEFQRASMILSVEEEIKKLDEEKAEFCILIGKKLSEKMASTTIFTAAGIDLYARIMDKAKEAFKRELRNSGYALKRDWTKFWKKTYYLVKIK